MRPPIDVELVSEDGEFGPEIVPAYSIPQMAIALGKDSLTVKRWIKSGLIPEPIYQDTAHGYKHYIKEEVMAICEELYRHYCEYQYFREDHQETIGYIAASVSRVRRSR